jgi:hypothetical protein
MPKRSSTTESPLSKAIIDLVTHEAEAQPEKNPAAVALGRMGGKKGGKARAESLSATKRRAIAKKAAAARWGKHAPK